MLDLITYTGLSIQYDTKKNKLLIDQNTTIFQFEQTVKLDEIKPTLLNRILTYPEYVYTEYRRITNCADQGFFDKSNIRHNLLLIPPNLLGIEYAKTHCYTSPLKEQTKAACILECIYGVMTVLIQVRKPKQLDGEVEVFESALIKAKKGERVIIPSGYDYVVYNTRSQICLVSKVYIQDFRLDYRSMKYEQGLCYYIIRKNARQETVINPRYKNTPKIKKIKPNAIMKKHQLEYIAPLYKEIQQNPAKFERILECFS